jgi:hypothetical protein
MIKVTNSMIIIIAFALAIFATSVSIYISGQEDAPLEECAEDVLEGVTGVDVDLTPNSPEPK